jgi:hypothetical protein
MAWKRSGVQFPLAPLPIPRFGGGVVLFGPGVTMRATQVRQRTPLGWNADVSYTRATTGSVPGASTRVVPMPAGEM